MKYAVAIKEQDHEARIYKAPIKGQIYVVKDVGDPDGKWIVDKNGEKVCGELSLKGRECFEEIDPHDLVGDIVEYEGSTYLVDETDGINIRIVYKGPHYDARVVSPEYVRLKRYDTDYSFHSMQPIDFVRDYLGYFESEPFKTECQGTFEEKSGGAMKKVNLNWSKIWVGDSEFLSSAVQQKLFTLGIRWSGGKTNIIKGLDSFYIHEGYFCHGSMGRGFYDEHEHEELSLDKLFSLTPEDVQIEKDLYLGEHKVEFTKNIMRIGCSSLSKAVFENIAGELKDFYHSNGLSRGDINTIQISDIIDFYENNRDRFQ